MGLTRQTDRDRDRDGERSLHEYLILMQTHIVSLCLLYSLSLPDSKDNRQGHICLENVSVDLPLYFLAAAAIAARAA